MKKLTQLPVVSVVTEGPKTEGLKKMLEEDVKKERTSDRPGDGKISDWFLLNDDIEQTGKNGRQTPSSPSCCWTGK